MTFGQSQERDWSTGSEAGGEHILTLHVWSRHAGRRQAQEIIEAIRNALHDRSLTLEGYRLVGLRHEFFPRHSAIPMAKPGTVSRAFAP